MDDLVERLRNGIIEHDKRWSGDTHADLGGSVDYDATENLMAEAAARIAELEAALRWEPIATAPQGEMVLGWADGMVRLVLRESGGWVQVGATIEASWFSPTHWMPLPEPPNAS